MSPLGRVWGLTPATSLFSQVEKLVKYLDPNDLGRINFKDFCRGVFAMKGEVIWGEGLRAPAILLSGRGWHDSGFCSDPPYGGPRSPGWF